MKTLRTRLADAEARACDPKSSHAEWTAAQKEVEALRRVLARGGS